MLSQELFSLLIPCTFSRMVVEECVSRTEQEVDSYSDINGDSEVKSSILKHSDIDGSVVRSSKLKYTDVESGSRVNISIIAHSDVKDGSTIVCSVVKHSEILKGSTVEKSMVKHSKITNTTILNTEIGHSEIKHSYIKDYREGILCYDIEYCNNRENIAEGKVHHFLFTIAIQVSLVCKVCKWTRKRGTIFSGCNRSSPTLFLFYPSKYLLPVLWTLFLDA